MNRVEIRLNKIFFVIIDQKRFLLLLNKKLNYCFFIPFGIFISKVNSQFFFLNNYFSKNNYLTSKIDTVQKPFNKIILLKGLGLKVSFEKTSRILILRLGFSHKISIFVDYELGFFFKKNIIYFQSFNKEKLGNFVSKIKHFKMPDSYRGKGVWLKNEKKLFKSVKKK